MDTNNCMPKMQVERKLYFIMCIYKQHVLHNSRPLLSSLCAEDVFLFLGCTCVTAGTMQSACSDGQCHCDRQTGACPCRENVAGHKCDQCAPNHWNYGQDRGCELCGCNALHAMGTHCNMVRKPKVNSDKMFEISFIRRCLIYVLL